MKRSRRSQLRDRLSELPDPLILRILSFLPMRDVVRTMILSNRWMDLWTTVPSLHFDAENVPSETASRNRRAALNPSDKFRNFVNGAMSRWKGTNIQKFSVNLPSESWSYTGLYKWLDVAIEKGVEEVCINLKGELPWKLYSCSTIRRASLINCIMEIKREVQWNQLKSLRIELVSLSKHTIEQVLRGAPQLEILILRFAESTGNLNIESNSLKRVKIERNLNPNENGRVYLPKFLTVEISTPNLETLEISGIHYNNFLLKDASSLSSAIVGFIDPLSDYISSSEFYKVLQGILTQVFVNIRHLEEVTLSGCSIKVLRKMKKENKDMLAPLSNVKLLTIHATHIGNMVDLLGIFPQLTKLVLLQDLGTRKDPHFLEVGPSTETCFSEFEAEISPEHESDFLLPCLKTVEITWTVSDDSVFRFVEMLSEHVRELETMVLQAGGTESSVTVDSWLLASETLVNLQKTFPDADVILCKD